MNAGVKKWALVSYLFLSVYLLAQPNSGKLRERAAALDAKLMGNDPALVTPALANALQISCGKVNCLLSLTNGKPSNLILARMLEQKGLVNDPAASSDKALQIAGVSISEAIGYLDRVEKQVTVDLMKASTLAKAPANTFVAVRSAVR